MMLPSIDMCACTMHEMWRKERTLAGEDVVASATSSKNMMVPWKELEEIDREVYRRHVTLVYAAINKINIHDHRSE